MKCSKNSRGRASLDLGLQLRQREGTKLTFGAAQTSDGSPYRNSHSNPSRTVLGAWIANGISLEKFGPVRSDSKVFRLRFRRLKTSIATETLPTFILKARATRRSSVELN